MESNSGIIYVLQRYEPYAMKNILGGTSQPVHTFRWKDIAISDSIDSIEKIKPQNNERFNYRIEKRNINQNGG